MDWNESILFVVQLNGKNSFERLYMLWRQQTLYDYSLQHYDPDFGAVTLKDGGESCRKWGRANAEEILWNF